MPAAPEDSKIPEAGGDKPEELDKAADAAEEGGEAAAASDSGVNEEEVRAVTKEANEELVAKIDESTKEIKREV